MKAIGMLVVAVLTSGCAASHDKVMPSTDNTLPKGRWEGQVGWSFQPDVENRGHESHYVIFVNCDEGPRVAYRLPDGSYALLARDLQASSFMGTHVLRGFANYQGEQPGWVQSVVWTVFEIEDGRLVAAHSRSVNNRGVPADDELRFYIASGSGVLKKTKECDR